MSFKSGWMVSSFSALCILHSILSVVCRLDFKMRMILNLHC